MKKDSLKNINPQPFSEQEKKQLKERIFHSIHALNRKKRRLQYTLKIAASITVLMGTGLYIMYNNEKPSITDFVKSSKGINVNESNKVTLILANNEDVNIEGDSTSISYSKTGEKVNIGNSKTIAQKTSKNKKAAFNTVLVPYGKRSKIKLSDGSLVWLNSGSKLIYPALFETDKREVYLEGEAIFDVTHNANSPFMVLSQNQKIKVLGTVFNVSSYPDEDNNFVVLESGSVHITYDENLSNKSMTISPGTKANVSIKTKKVSSKIVDVNHYFAWRDGILVLKKHDLQYIMKRLSRYYNVPITIQDKDLAKQTFTGYLDLKEDVEKVIEIISKTTDLKYKKINHNQINITN
ncbi:FecR family protein [Flavivirga eckloniae]|nr:FecR domain-containing protein [Flavivirga eckloniae]